MEFQELNLHPDLMKGIQEAGFTTCMPVQEKVFSYSLSGKDIYAQSQTGTGKTAAFLISIFQRIMTDPELRTKKALILAPTRELAVQIEEECEKLGKYLDIKAGSFYGGVAYGPQVDMLREDVQIIVGTPGRLIDLLQQGKMLLQEVRFLVIDEADRMFDMGFIDDIRKLLRYLPKAENRQTYLFSATLGLRVKDIAWEYMRDPAEIAIEPEHVTVDLVTQELYHVGSHEKFSLLLGLLDREKPESCLIFCNQKFMVEEVARKLKVNGYDCEYIMGDLPQAKRLEVIERVKAGEIKMLVATDVAARGLDIDALALVINYDVPEDAESYVHRIGRTARAGKAGKAITLACEKFVYGLYGIEKYLGSKIPVMPFEEALLFPDKSAGMRFSRDRGGSGRGRDDRRYGSQDRGRSGARAGGARSSGPRRDSDRGKDQRQRPAERQGAERNDQRQRPVPAGGREDNPYAVSQDERLKQYKEKYGGQNSGRRGQGGRPEGQRPDRGRPQGRPTPQQGQGRPSGQGQRSGQSGRPQGQRAQSQSQRGREAQKAAPVPAKAQTKVGLFAKIKGLFGGKKKAD